MIIATHNKLMHADEITAIALIKIFIDENITVKRVSHQTEDFSKYDLVIDIGKKHDGVKFFDHHQYRGGKSSAGLIWDFIGLNTKYKKISKFVHSVDMHDVGIKKAQEFEYSSLIKCFNTQNISSSEQDNAFEEAVAFTQKILTSMKTAEENMLLAKEIVANSFLFNSNPHIIELSEYTPHWGTYINGSKTPYVKAVVWEDIEDNNWKIQIPSKNIGSFELNSKKLKQNSSMDFVHNAGYFAISKTRDEMIKFITFNKL